MMEYDGDLIERGEDYTKAFRSALKKLLNRTYVVKSLKTDAKDYDFIFMHQREIGEYISRMGLELVHYNGGVMAIQNADDGPGVFPCMHFKRLELAMFVIMREWYTNNRDVTSLTSVIRRRDLLLRLGEYIGETMLRNKTAYKEALAKLAKYRFIEKPKDAEILKEDSAIILYPTLMISVDENKTASYLEEVRNDLCRLKQDSEVNFEETEEEESGEPTDW